MSYDRLVLGGAIDSLFLGFNDTIFETPALDLYNINMLPALSQNASNISS
jgi:hypothetical protein